MLVNNYISTQIYNLKNTAKEKRAYIYNSRTHEFLLLTGHSAVIWNFLGGGEISPPNKELHDYLEKYKLTDSFLSFIEELKKNDLISDESSFKKKEMKSLLFECSPRQNPEATKFMSEMQEWTYNNGYLSILFIELTNECNLKCIHCYKGCLEEKKEIRFESIKQMIDDAYSIGVFRVIVSGGECTLNKDFLRICKYIREKRMMLDICTNGQSLYDNKKLFNEVIKLYPRIISLSLYSMNPNIHDKITKVKGSHNKTLSVIKKLANLNQNTEIKCFLTKYNVKDWQEVSEFGENLGVNVSFDATFLNSKKNNNEDVQVTEEQLYDLYSDPQSPFFIEKLPMRNINEEFLNEPICWGGKISVAINADLDILPCATVDINLGNLKNISLKDIWENKPQNLKNWCNLRKKDIINCFKSEHCRYCSYCPGMAICESGRMEKYLISCKHSKIKSKINKEITKGK